MEFLKLISLCVVILTMVPGRRRMTKADDTRLKVENMKLLWSASREGPIMCTRLEKEPYFEVEMLLGQTWRVYYTWNMDLQKQCLDLKFRNATPEIVNRMHKDMSDYLETEPNWGAATVLIMIGPTKHEVLLFAAEGSPGRFQGVPNLVGDKPSMLRTMPQLNFYMKLMYGGKYLLMADCKNGLTTLSGHKKNIPHRSEITNIAKNLDFGPGLHACISDDKDEITQHK